MLLPLLLHAVAQIPVPWQCSFEATEDLSDWVLNPGTAGANDQWTLGSNTRSAGDSALYISTDGGENAIAGAKQNVVMAYRKIHFPEHASGKSMHRAIKSMIFLSIGKQRGMVSCMFFLITTLI